MRDSLLVVDQDQRYSEATQYRLKLDPARDAHVWRNTFQCDGRRGRRVALVAEADTRGMLAFQAAGYEILTVVGDRLITLAALMKQIDMDIAARQLQDVILVTKDPALIVLCDRTLCRKTPPVHLLVAGVTPTLESRAAPCFQSLDDMLPGIKRLRVDIRLDFENLYIELTRKGIPCTPTGLVDAIRCIAAQVGEVVHFAAYADWHIVAKPSGRDVQRELVQAGVQTHYQINRHGKNLADMEIADDIRTLLERPAVDPDGIDVIVLATSDRDFRPVVETAKARGKRIVVVSLEGSLSRDLASAAGEVYYLDPYLVSSQSSPEGHLSETQAMDTLVETALRTYTWLRSKGYTWGYADSLATSAAPGMLGMQRIRQAIEAGILIQHLTTSDRVDSRPTRTQKLALNTRHPVVQTVQDLYRQMTTSTGTGANSSPVSHAFYLATA